MIFEVADTFKLTTKHKAGFLTLESFARFKTMAVDISEIRKTI